MDDEPKDDDPRDDADVFQEALNKLVAGVKKVIDLRSNLADYRQRRVLQEPYEEYCRLIERLYASEQDE